MRAKDGRMVSASTFVSGLIVPLYNDDNWPLLTQALDAALKGDASPFLRLADFSADREPNGNYTSNSTFAFNAINCLDYPMVMRHRRHAGRGAAAAAGFAHPGLLLRLRRHQLQGLAVQERPDPGPGGVQRARPPIVVVGTTGDPATPVEWASALRKQLGNASLLTWKGEGHTAYGRSNGCIGNAVDSYLVDGKTPADNTVC